MSKSRYDAIAAWYDAAVRSPSFGGDVVLASVFALADDVRGHAICDLACGQGRVARELARRGAAVVGVDLSAELIAIAQRDEDANPVGITYLVDDAEQLACLPDARFDGVVCNLALMDIPDLAAVFHAVWRVLRPAGWFIFSITHPCFESPHARWLTHENGTVSREVRQYTEEGLWFSHNKQGVRGQVGAHHRTLATYLNTLSDTGFSIEHTVEPRATSAAGTVPGYRIIPVFLLMRCVKSLV